MVSNGGNIAGTSSVGVRLASGGQVTNATGGSITGPVGVQVYGSAGTVTNNGTISGTTKAVVFTGTGANRLVAGSTSVFIGSVAGSTAAGSSNTLELAGGTGILNGLTGGAGKVTENAHSWSFSNFGTIALDAGAGWTLSGGNTVATILDNGTIDLGGALTVSSAIDAASTGVFKLDGNALEVAAAVGSGSQISFLGSSRLTVDITAAFGTGVGTGAYTGPVLENFAADDKVDLKTFGQTGVLLNYDTATGLLQISNNANQVASLAFQTSSLGIGGFHAVSDVLTGIFITRG